MSRKDEPLREAKARDVALFRYALARQIADESLTAKQRGLLVRHLAAQEHRGPDGRMVKVSRSTLDRWTRAWKRSGFDGLLPPARQVAPRTPEHVLAMAVGLKRENPMRTAAQVGRIMAATSADAIIVPSARTLQRHFADLGLNKPAVEAAAFGRFEADTVNARWTGDCLHGPQIGGAKAILFAWIDDHSRRLIAWRWVRREDAIRGQGVLRAGIQAHGIPESVYLDNGAPFVDGQLKKALAVLGVRLIHSRPGQPAGRGKIERFFRTVRDGFLVEINDANPIGRMDELNAAFTAWVEGVYHTRVHTETGQTPNQRWEAAWTQRAEAGKPGPNWASSTQLHEAFLWSTRRQVNKTAVIHFASNKYQVDASLIGCQIELVYDPFDLDHIDVRYRGRTVGAAVPFEISTHVHPKARPDETTPSPAQSSGIDYLAAIRARHETQQLPQIAFTALSTERDHAQDGQGVDHHGDGVHRGNTELDRHGGGELATSSGATTSDQRLDAARIDIVDGLTQPTLWAAARGLTGSKADGEQVAA